MEKLKDYYYDPKIGLVSAEKFYRRLKEMGVKTTRKEVQDFINKQFTAQINKEAKRPKEFSSIVAGRPRSQYQMDIMIYDRYRSGNYRYILCVVDIYSRYAQCKALTSMEMPKIMEAVKSVFNEMGIPKNVNCDNQFNTKLFLDYCEDNKITLHLSDPDEINKNAIVERFNRTLARMIQRWRQSTKGNEWFKVLPELVENYNNSFHRTIQAKPIDLWEGRAESKQKIIVVDSKLKEGDIVRIKHKKKVLEKGDYITHSKETYLIAGKDKGKFILKDTSDSRELSRRFKPYELQLANVIQYKDNTPQAEEQEPKKQRRAREKIRRTEEGLFYID
jgi:hypothetical protein